MRVSPLALSLDWGYLQTNDCPGTLPHVLLSHYHSSSSLSSIFVPVDFGIWKNLPVFPFPSLPLGFLPFPYCRFLFKPNSLPLNRRVLCDGSLRPKSTRYCLFAALKTLNRKLYAILLYQKYSGWSSICIRQCTVWCKLTMVAQCACSGLLSEIIQLHVMDGRWKLKIR